MPVTATPVGTSEIGGGGVSGLGASTAQILKGSKLCKDRQSMRVVVRVAATGTFNLDYLFSGDGGTTWVVGVQKAGAAVTVDGGTAGYTYAAELDISVGYLWSVQVYNTSVGNINLQYEVREYSDSG